MGEECRASAIPVIDMNDIPCQLSKFKEVCEEWGCFRVVNHGVPAELMAEMKMVSRSLLDLPLEMKQQFDSALRPGLGYLQRKETPAYESLGLYDVTTPNSLDQICSLLEVSSHQKDTIQAYTEEVTRLAAEIGERLAQSLGLEGTGFFKEWPCQFRLNKYTFTPEMLGTSGLFAHTDPGLLTILQDDDDVRGLEVVDNSGSYISVDSCPGTFIVQLGDTAVAWSNGKLRSAKHHVQCKEPGVRISIGGFVLPPKELAVEAPIELVERHPPRLYIPFTYDAYKEIRMTNRIPDDGALSFLLAQS